MYCVVQSSSDAVGGAKVKKGETFPAPQISTCIMDRLESCRNEACELLVHCCKQSPPNSKVHGVSIVEPMSPKREERAWLGWR